ncbi:glycosyl transferase family protein [Sandarakinorhabdus sp. AAP62]|uniref:glycosyl transferase family protein n=1 Tax=Sandarakinorhabdus sp. AAP62 TaxID=1248916 RepID=UPI0002EBEB2F|nr:glycosyl transferase family protein [Sandarakinorhabdus sp. AAP62]
MMLPELLALWHVALAEALLLVALLVAINGLDDLAIDLLWLLMPRHRRAPQPFPPVSRLGSALPRFAILIPAWDESAVIGAMLQRLLATQDWPDYTVFVGLYPNDPKGQAAVAALADPRLHAVIGEAPGPTTKADCLNGLWQAALAQEVATGRRFAAVVLHDAEDVVHAHELAVFAAHLPQSAMVQLPVLPLPDADSPLISGHYIDEFAEAHAKDLLVRHWLGAAVPAAGVGVAIDRAMLGRIADARGGLPFDAASLTEDYELGQHVHALGGRGRLVWVKAEDGPVATREHFPATLAAAVRQKSRWLIGIALAGWDRLGWRGGWVNRWMLLRDRKAPLMALLTLSAYVIALLLGIDGLLRLALPMAAQLPPVAGGLTRALLWLNWTLLCWRLLVRALFTLRVQGVAEALLATPRALVGNMINAMAALRALSLYAKALRSGRRLAWDKTLHRFPVLPAGSAP